MDRHKMKGLFIRFSKSLLLFLLLSGIAHSQQVDKSGLEKMNPKMKTLGGRQFWSDIHFFREWRIQKNVLTNHCRLLDGNDRRFASGTFKHCLEKLTQQRRADKLQPMCGEAVVLLHGITRSSKSFEPLQRELKKQGYLVFSVDYPSTQITIQQAASNLQQVLKSLEGIETLSLVGHSMGGLVIRAWTEDYEDSRLDRVIMLGTPNQGAEMADFLKAFLPYQWVMGKAGQQLGTDKQSAPALLPAPRVPFGIIAGGRGEQTIGYNPLLPGDNDGTVTVASAHLEGESDFLRIPCLHMSYMRDQKVIEAVVHFLEDGSFCPDSSEPDSANEKNQ